MLFPLKHIRQDMMTPKFVLANDYSLGHYYYKFFFCLYHIIRVLKNKDAPIQFEQLFFFIFFLIFFEGFWLVLKITFKWLWQYFMYMKNNYVEIFWHVTISFHRAYYTSGMCPTNHFVKSKTLCPFHPKLNAFTLKFVQG